MGVTVQWDNDEKTIIRYDLEGRWTWDEFHRALDEAVRLRSGVPHMVDVIANLENSAGLPPNVLSQLKRVYRVKMENRGMVVMAGGGGLVSALVQVFTKLYRRAQNRVMVTASVDEARAAIRKLQAERGQENAQTEAT